MAGSSSNWYKRPGGVKGSVYVSRADVKMYVDASRFAFEVPELRDGITYNEARQVLRDNPSVLNDLVDILNPQPPKGVAKSAIPAAAKPAEFNPKVTIIANDEERGRIQQRLGLDHPVTDREIAGLVGALDGATISISYGDIDITHPLYTAKRSLTRTANGPVISNNYFRASSDAPPTLATRIVARQMDQAAALGVKNVDLWAEGDITDKNYNGYYTWPRLGYNNTKILKKAHMQAKLPPDLRDSIDLIDLFSRPGGPEWWKANGEGCSMDFDPAPGSRSRQALDDYLAIKRIDPYAPFP